MKVDQTKKAKNNTGILENLLKIYIMIYNEQNIEAFLIWQYLN